MKLLIISPSFFPSTYYGGPSISVYYLSSALALLLSDLSVVTTDANGKERLSVTKNKYIEVDKNLSVKYYSNSTSFGLSFKMVLNLWRDIKANEIIYIVSLFSLQPQKLFSFLFSLKKR